MNGTPTPDKPKRVCTSSIVTPKIAEGGDFPLCRCGCGVVQGNRGMILRPSDSVAVWKPINQRGGRLPSCLRLSCLVPASCASCVRACVVKVAVQLASAVDSFRSRHVRYLGRHVRYLGRHVRYLGRHVRYLGRHAGWCPRANGWDNLGRQPPHPASVTWDRLWLVF